MMITLRLDPLLEEEINTVAKNLGLTKSGLVRESILEYLDKQKSPNAWDIGQDLFGKYASGINHRSVDRKKLLKEKIRAKRS